jgi:hypothetical protein
VINQSEFKLKSTRYTNRKVLGRVRGLPLWLAVDNRRFDQRVRCIGQSSLHDIGEIRCRASGVDMSPIISDQYKKLYQDPVVQVERLCEDHTALAVKAR